MKNNLTNNKIKVLGIISFLLLSALVIQNLSSTDSAMEIKEVDVKLGQLSDTTTVSKGEAVGSVSKRDRKPVVVVGEIVSKPLSSFAGTAGGENCSLALTFKLDKDVFSLGSNSNYTMDVKNAGAETCVNASISVYYSNNQSFVSSVPKPSASNYYWVLGDILQGITKSISFSTTYKAGDVSLNSVQTEACATADDSEDACATLVSNLGTTTSAPIASAPVVESPVVNDPVAVVGEVTPFNPDTREYGTWVWTSPYAMSATYRDKVIAGAVANKINVIYITIDDYLAINSLPAGLDKDTKKRRYSDALENFIILANKNNIQVDVEAGWRDWAEDPNATKANVVIDYAIEYNNSRANKIRSFQFDVEPYLLTRYEQNKASVLTNFVNFINNATNRLGSNNIRLSVVIPHFYDSAQRWTPAITYNNSSNYTFNHILNILDRRPGSSIILMSYRNKAEGTDGSILISKTEVDQASVGTGSTKVIVGQETGNVEPGYVTFYQTSKANYINQINIINNQFKGSKNFGGISAHYIDPLMDLQ